MHPVNSPWNLVACHPAKELHLARSAKSSWLRPASPRCTERSFKKYVLIKCVYRHLLPTLGSWGAEAPQQKANPDRHWKLMVLFPSFRATRKKQIWVHILCIFVREHRHQQVLKQFLTSSRLGSSKGAVLTRRASIAMPSKKWASRISASVSSKRSCKATMRFSQVAAA